MAKTKRSPIYPPPEGTKISKTDRLTDEKRLAVLIAATCCLPYEFCDEMLDKVCLEWVKCRGLVMETEKKMLGPDGKPNLRTSIALSALPGVCTMSQRTPAEITKQCFDIADSFIAQAQIDKVLSEPSHSTIQAKDLPTKQR